MKKSILFLSFLFIIQFTYGQGANWKQIDIPFKSYVKILTQTSKGAIIGSTSNYIGYVISHDDGESWSYLPLNISLGNSRFIGEDFNGRILYHTYPNFYRLDLNTFEVDTFPTKNSYDVKFLASFNDDFIVAHLDNRIVSIFNDGTVKGLGSLSDNFLVLSSSLSPSIYIVTKSSVNNFLYKVKSDGTYESKGFWPKQDAKYFLHANNLIRDTEYSMDEGKSWTSYNVPFTKPDSIFNYNGNLAFGKGNKIYYKPSSANVFESLDLPPNTTYRNAIIGKTIVTQLLVENVSENKILLQPNSQFKPLLFNLEAPYATSFAAGANECLIATDANNNAYVQKGLLSQWIATEFKCFNYSFFASDNISFSFNRDNIISLFDQNTLDLLTSNDCGEHWTKTTKMNNSPYNFTLSEKKIGTIWSGDSTLAKRKPNTLNWNILKRYKDMYHATGYFSNQLIGFTIEPFTESFGSFDTIGRRIRIIDVPYYVENFNLHYEMNYIYSKSIRNGQKAILSRSFDNGTTFETIKQSSFITSPYAIKLLWTGHMLQVHRQSLYISDDYGLTWKPIDLQLSNRDYIKTVNISPDNYLYILTAEKGILKLINPLPSANIIRFNIKDDIMGDCQVGNDTTVVKNIKVSLEGQATQLTDADGNAVFYTFRKDNKLIIHNDAKTLNICQDTIPVNFSNDNGLETQIAINTSTIKTCPNLSLKFNSHQDSIGSGINFNVIIVNNGNETSSPTNVKIELDPYQYLYYFYPGQMQQINTNTILLKVNALKPGEVFAYSLNIQSRPDTPYNINMCTSAQVVDFPNQCLPNTKTTICLPIDRNNRNKTIKVSFYHDKNGNCLQDAGEPFIKEHFCIENNVNNVYYNYDSSYYVQTKFDTNTIKIIFDKDLYKLCQDVYKVTIPTDSLLFILNIPVKDIKHCSKLNTSIVRGRFIRCFDSNLQFYVRNNGNIKSGNKKVTINIDAYFDVKSVSPLPTAINGKTYTFDIGGIEKNDFSRIKFEFNISCDAPLGFLHCYDINLQEETPTCNISTNYTKLCAINGGSWDPNDKTIIVSGSENKKIMTKDDKIEYKIRFQNTGTDTAYTVRIEDYLDSKFELSSMKLVHATHRCTWKILNNKLIVEFMNINLVDSFTNEAGSHGEILFEIKLKKDVKINDRIYNQANIYFDFNTPVVTNKVENYFGIVSSINDIKIPNKSQLNFIPNPTSQESKIIGINLDKAHTISIYSSLGKLVNNIKLEIGKDVLDFTAMASGAYYLIVWDGVEYKYGSIVKI